ncbi:MAG: sigma-54-dependent transcriptional regulator [Deferrisomatales bacterium]
MDQTLLVIDDEEMIRSMLSEVMAEAGYTVTAAADGQEALDALELHGPAHFDFVLCDIKMPRVDGLQFLERARAMECAAPIVVMSAYGSVDTAIEAIHRGACDYISKPFKRDEVLFTLRKVEERERLLRENRELRRALERDYGFESIVARSGRMRAAVEMMRKVADVRSAVLFLGEPGTGKEMLARALHYNSHRKGGPFVAVNCSGIHEQLLEAELFGQERGAFIDATRTRRGALEEAEGGTLFLKEIGDLPSFLQVRLLRALQEGASRRVGGSRDIRVDVRVVASAVRGLEEEVSQGRFREDLFYRLNVIPIAVPPLRERRDDTPLLVNGFLRRYARETGTEVRSLTPDAMEAVLRHAWKGNVRELENVLERAVVLSEGAAIEASCLAPWLIEEAAGEGSFRLEPGDCSIKKVVARVEEELIGRALRQTHGNRTEASRILEISHRTLLYKMKDYGIQG